MEVLTYRSVTAAGETLEHIPTEMITSAIIQEFNNGDITATFYVGNKSYHLTNDDDAKAFAKSFKGVVVNKKAALAKEKILADNEARRVAARDIKIQEEELKRLEAEKAVAEKEAKIAAIKKKREEHIAKVKADQEARRIERDAAKESEESLKVKEIIKDAEAKITKSKAKAKAKANKK